MKAIFAAAATLAVLTLAAAYGDEPLYPNRPISNVHISLLGAETGKWRELSPVQSGQVRDIQAGDPRIAELGPIVTNGAAGGEVYSGAFVDAELHGPPNTTWHGANLRITVYYVPDGPGPTKPDSIIAAKRVVRDIAFGPSGVDHEGLFVTGVGPLCHEGAITVELAKPSDAEKAAPYFCCPRSASEASNC
jgi:hypothetical protein